MTADAHEIKLVARVIRVTRGGIRWVVTREFAMGGRSNDDRRLGVVTCEVFLGWRFTKFSVNDKDASMKGGKSPLQRINFCEYKTRTNGCPSRQTMEES